MPGMGRIFVTRPLPGDGLAPLAAAHEFDVWPGPLPPDPPTLRDRVATAEGLVCTLNDRIDSELIAAASQLRAIANYAVGSDNIDLGAARARGIPVGVTPDVLTAATAELAWALLLAAARHIPAAAASTRAGDWHTWETERWLGAELAGGTLLVLGAGRIGRAMAARAAGWEMEVKLAGRGEEPPWEEADFVSLHVPLTDSTRGLVGLAVLARMKPSAILVNTARGAVVQTDALEEALRTGAIAAAALDVTDPEPLPPEHPLFSRPNLIVTPHIGSATRVARRRMTALCGENLTAGLAGEPMPHPA